MGWDGVFVTGEMFGALKGRLTDPNKNLIVLTMTTIATLATAMGPAVDKASRGILGDVLRCLSDPKRQMREAVTRTLDAWVGVGALDKLLPHLATALLDGKVGADGRKELLEWTSKQMEGASPTLELHLLLKPVAASFQVIPTNQPTNPTNQSLCPALQATRHVIEKGYMMMIHMRRSLIAHHAYLLSLLL